MNGSVELSALLEEVDRALKERDLGTVDLYLLGGGSLILFEGRRRTTRDLDVVEERVRSSNPAALALLEAAFGKGSGRSPYLDLISAGLPPLPIGWLTRAVQRPTEHAHIRLWTLDLVDVVVSKLRRWLPRDRDDIRFLCDHHPEIRARLADLDDGSFWATDWWDEVMAPRRDRVLAYIDGHVDVL